MYTSIKQFFEESQKCTDAFDAFALKHDLVGKAQADHICYKCSSNESFEKIRALFESESLYMYQSIISGRRIAIVRFKEGIDSVLGVINFFELSDQKPDGSQKEGFDHIEVYPTAGTYEEMIAKLEETETVVKVERPHHTTHDIALDGGFIFRCEHEPLITKIKEGEMV